MANENGLVTTPGITAMHHRTGDCGVECDTAGRKFFVNVAGVTVFEASGTSQTWKGHSGFAGSGITRVSAGLRTTDNTASSLLSISIPSGKGIFATAFVGCKQVDESDASAFQVVAAASNASGTSALKGTPNVVAVESAAATVCTFDVDDTTDTLRLRVTGITGETWDWVGYVDYFLLDSSS